MVKIVKKSFFALLLGIFILLPFISFANNTEKQKYLQKSDNVRIDEKTGEILFIRFREGEEIPTTEFHSMMKAILSMQDNQKFELVRSERDQIGMNHLRYQLMVNGIPVMGGIYIAHIKNGMIRSVNGESFKVSGPLTPGLSEAQALSKALDQANGSLYKWEVPAEEAYIKALNNDPNATWFPKGELEFAPEAGSQYNEFQLCWKFDVYAIEPLYRAFVYVNANSGKVIFEHQQILHNDVQAIAVTKYSDTVRIVTDSISPGQFRLYESGRGGGIHTRNMQNGTNQSNWVEFTDTDNFWNNFNANIDEIGTDGHYAMEMTYDYYMSKHSRNSYNGNGSPLICNLHYGTNYQNAFWDGNSAQFGDAGGLPFASMDISGHEVSHGVVGNSAGLVYQDESGALNESFADIFGNSIEYFAKPNDFNWDIGEDLAGGGFRNMANPNQFGDPDTYFGSGWATGTFDNGGVHTNSGVQNYWYYLLVEGGSGTNDNNESYSVQGLGWDTAGAIAYRNLNVYLGTFSDYSDAQFYSIESANDLYGVCSAPMQETMNAWHAAGVGSPFAAQVSANFVEDYHEFCFLPGPVQFQNTSPGAITSHWNFGDGNVSTQFSPAHTYFGQGSFTVTLTVTGCGNTKDTLIKPNYIVLNPGAHCNMSMPQNTTETRESCTGTLWDTGGPTANYFNNSTSKLLIAPTSAISITLTFNSFDFATAGDFIRIYDGPDENAPLIGTYSGTTLPNGGSIISTGGTLFIVESTNGFQNFPGFELEWSCAVSSDPALDDAEGLNVYPNPSTGLIRIDFELTQMESYQLSLTDLLGKVLFTETGSEIGILNREIDLNRLPKGIYLLNLRTQRSLKTRKVILE